jgi:integrase
MSRKPWTKSIGEYGNRVRVYEARVGGPLYRSVYINGKEERKSLGHRDRQLAVRQARELHHELCANDSAILHESLTLGRLVDLYISSEDHRDKKQRTAREDERKLQRIATFIGLTRDVRSLDASDVKGYTRARRVGDARLVGVKEGKAVNARTIQADVVALQTALNWAIAKRNDRGQRYLKENPLAGIAVPNEVNPRRPVMTHTVYEALLVVSPQVDRLLHLGLIVAEGTGRRLSAWCSLRWEDVLFEEGEFGSIRWRAEFDKRGYEQVVPMSEAVRDALKGAQVQQGAIGKAPVFPSPNNPAESCRRDLLDKWLRRAYKLANLEPGRGSLWHAMRRKWVTERKDYSVKDIAVAGGWRNAGTVSQCYLQSDPETVRNVVLHPKMRLVNG